MVDIFVTGRVCLFGEHSDWAGELRRHDPSLSPGACLVVGTDQGLRARAQASAHFEIRSRMPDGTEHGPFVCAMDGASLRSAAEAAEFFSYAAGVAEVVRQRFAVGGILIDVSDRDLPVQRGLSSSAAICVLVARAFSGVYQLGLSLRQEMEFAYQGELLTGSQCGRMDQACAFGATAVLLRFDGDHLDVEPLTIGGAFHLLVVDLCAYKDTRRILADLHAAVEGGDGAIRHALGRGNLTLVEAARQALRRGDAPRLGALMSQAQQMFDECVAPACPSQLAAPRLHAVLANPSVARLAYGGKGVGSQGDGTAQIVCRDSAGRAELTAVLEAVCGVRCLPLTLLPTP